MAPRRGTTGNANDGQLVYGPMEAGFSADQTTQNFGCTNGLTLLGGIDTLMAERMVSTALSGPIFTILTVLSWICVGIHMCGALPSPVLA